MGISSKVDQQLDNYYDLFYKHKKLNCSENELFG